MTLNVVTGSKTTLGIMTLGIMVLEHSLMTFTSMKPSLTTGNTMTPSITSLSITIQN